jgi:Flp pilus assembly protein protease CpaA
VDPVSVAKVGLIVALAAVGAVWDVRTGRVPNTLTYAAVLAGLVLNALLPSPAGLGLGNAALGVVVAAGPLFLVYLAGGLGGGDVKLMAAVGAFLGYRDATYALLYACIAGAVLSIATILWKEGVGGAWLRFPSFFRRRRPRDGDLPRLRFPFAVAALVGVAWAGTEQVLNRSVLDVFSGGGAA